MLMSKMMIVEKNLMTVGKRRRLKVQFLTTYSYNCNYIPITYGVEMNKSDLLTSPSRSKCCCLFNFLYYIWLSLARLTTIAKTLAISLQLMFCGLWWVKKLVRCHLRHFLAMFFKKHEEIDILNLRFRLIIVFRLSLRFRLTLGFKFILELNQLYNWCIPSLPRTL